MLRQIAYKIYGPLKRQDIKYIQREMNEYNRSRVWNGCRGVVIDRSVFNDPLVEDIHDIRWPLVAASMVSYQDYADEAAIVGFFLQLTENYDGRLRIYLRDDVHGVLFGIPRWIEEGKITPAVTEEELDQLLERFPDAIKDEMRRLTHANYLRACRGEWRNGPFAPPVPLKLTTDARLLHQLAVRFKNDNFSQVVVDLTRGFIGMLNQQGEVEVDTPFDRKDESITITVPSSFMELVVKTAQEAQMSVEEFILFALSYGLLQAW